MNFFKRFSQQKDKTYIPLSKVPNEEVPSGDYYHVFSLSKEKLNGNSVDKLDSEALKMLSDKSIKQYNVYDTPRVKKKGTEEYETLDEKLVRRGNCPICGNRVEEDEVFTIEYTKERMKDNSIEVQAAAALVSLHINCAAGYDLRDIEISVKG